MHYNQVGEVETAILAAVPLGAVQDEPGSAPMDLFKAYFNVSL
jgi:hypothetical protein